MYKVKHEIFFFLMHFDGVRKMLVAAAVLFLTRLDVLRTPELQPSGWHGLPFKVSPSCLSMNTWAASFSLYVGQSRNVKNAHRDFFSAPHSDIRKLLLFSIRRPKPKKNPANPLTSDIFPWKVRNLFFQLKKSCIPLWDTGLLIWQMWCAGTVDENIL